jgi:YD repeat-containing protein
MMNGKAKEKESIIVVDSIYVFISDSIVGAYQCCNQDTMKVVIKDEWNNNGRNPFYSRIDTAAKYKQHSIRELDITQEGWVIDKSIDSIYYNGHYFYSSYKFCINDDSISMLNYRNVNGGVGYGGLYIKGYRVSQSGPHGGYYIVKRCPDDTTHSNLPIGEQQYKYEYDSLGRLVTISNSDDNTVVYSKKFNDVEGWNEIQFRDLVIKRNKP